MIYVLILVAIGIVVTGIAVRLFRPELFAAVVQKARDVLPEKKPEPVVAPLTAAEIAKPSILDAIFTPSTAKAALMKPGMTTVGSGSTDWRLGNSGTVNNVKNLKAGTYTYTLTVDKPTRAKVAWSDPPGFKTGVGITLEFAGKKDSRANVLGQVVADVPKGTHEVKVTVTGPTALRVQWWDVTPRRIA